MVKSSNNRTLLYCVTDILELLVGVRCLNDVMKADIVCCNRASFSLSLVL